MKHDIKELDARFGSQNYRPLPVVLDKGEGVWLWDTDGKKYLDMMSAYSAVSHGHCHPELVETMHLQAQTLAMCSRAFFSDKLPLLLERLCNLLNYDRALIMNSGAEAIETAIKAARRWGYLRKGIPDNKAEIIVFSNNFHGRTVGIISFSSDDEYKHQFGPYLPGFHIAPYGDIEAVQKLISKNTCAVLVEPIQGEAGIVIPPKGWLKKLEQLCKTEDVLLICDEIQSGLGRTGTWLACEHENVKPDAVTLGKALGGGLYPVSAVVGREDLMNVFNPGSHGSTFGGNPLACAIAHKSLDIMERDQYLQNSANLGKYFLEQLKTISAPCIKSVRGLGLWIGVELDPAYKSGRTVCEALMEKGILSKETHETVVRFAPPLIITKNQIDDAIGIIEQVFVR
ncbi:MAG: ornithine--oxo-acid transaminase [Proteobacteria bacterium]|nr:ornithine--oxo-acid transaminase [Pseudomonadota bacterium]